MVSQRTHRPVIRQFTPSSQSHGLTSESLRTDPPIRRPWHQTLGFVTAIAILAASSFAGTAVANEVTAGPTVVSANSTSLQSPANPSLAAGSYLYGDSIKRDEIGQSYWVFQVTPERHVIGAMYAPFSSFDCFHGREAAMQLNVLVRDSYTQATAPLSLPLDQLQPISDLSATDHQLLQTCRANLRPQIQEAMQVTE